MTEGSSFGAAAQYRRILWVILAINAAMALGEGVGGWLAQSRALQADALDFAGDTATYGLTLWALGRSAATRARAGLIKGLSLGLLALVVLGATVYRFLVAAAPEPALMSGIGAVALLANATSAALLTRHRQGDANIRSVWLCSRNDAIGNALVIAAGGLVALTGTRWPDLAVALLIAGLFLHSSIAIVRQSLAELRRAA